MTSAVAVVDDDDSSDEHLCNLCPQVSKSTKNLYVSIILIFLCIVYCGVLSVECVLFFIIRLQRNKLKRENIKCHKFFSTIFFFCTIVELAKNTLL